MSRTGPKTATFSNRETPQIARGEKPFFSPGPGGDDG
jgi:hypothetical protein